VHTMDRRGLSEATQLTLVLGKLLKKSNSLLSTNYNSVYCSLCVVHIKLDQLNHKRIDMKLIFTGWSYTL